ncbi:MobF family relaxase [Yinghuangia sp. ASG 101]|uniref:MobF family relaxase n=1 Tax=Yinghuangia sp. ASG 101 TaxID=2896848 RepID=UPI0022B23EC3|nr:MobF family relaxase [Yinghuangia sp. ASG 101]
MLSITPGSDHTYLVNQVGRGAEHYLMRTVGMVGEPPGVWWGAGARALGLTGEVDARVMAKPYGDMVHPATGLPMGSRPAVSRPLGERLARALDELPPDATPEERRATEQRVRSTQRRNVKYFDLTFSAPKSWSVLHAGFQARALRAAEDGDDVWARRWEEAADQVWAAQMEGVRAALAFLQDEAGYSRAGRNGVRRVTAREWTVAMFRQHTSRSEEPQMHVHCAVLNRVWTTERDPATGQVAGKWRTLDGKALFALRREAGVVYERVAGEALYRDIGARSALRPDGKAREILGISRLLCDMFSGRRKAIVADVASRIAAYERLYGQPPSAYRKVCMARDASLRTRTPKKRAGTARADLVDRWHEATAKLRDTLVAQPDGVFRAAAAAGAEPEPYDRMEVVAEALRRAQAEKAVFTRADVMVHIDRLLPDCLGGLDADGVRTLLGGLTDEAMTQWQREAHPERPDVVLLAKPELVPVPAELTVDDGLSAYSRTYRAPYTTDGHLAAETDVMEAARGPADAPTVPDDIVDGIIAASRLAATQAAAVRDIATSGRRVDVLVGPAGTGKSHTVARISRAWQAAGGAVLGLAVGQRQANVLAEEGVPTTDNIRMFRTANARIAAGGQVPDADRYVLRPGQLVIVDEAATCATDDLVEILRLARAAGAKVLLTGDFAQTTAIGAGGMFGHLAATFPHTHTLAEVHRFHAAWERVAGLRLRLGDAAVLDDYDTRNRLHGGTGEAMKQAACRAWLTDDHAGRSSALIATTNREASELSGRVRAELVRRGRVEAQGVALRDGNLAGIGDRVQLRAGDRGLTTADKRHWAANRDIVTVRRRGPDGSLEVAYPDGATMTLPREYVAGHVELAYAGTIHAIQAATVDTAHALVDPRMSREQLYVALSRGRHANHAYVATDEPGVPAAERRDHWAVLTAVLRRSEEEATALRVMRDEMDRADSLAELGPIWTDLVESHYAARHGRALTDALGDATWREMAAEDAYGALLCLARQGEERGHDVAALLRTAVASGPLDDARSLSAVLHWRLTGLMDRAETWRAAGEEAAVAAEHAAGLGTEPELRARRAAARRADDRRRAGYCARTPHIDGPVGEYARQIAAFMDARVTALGLRAAADPPEWLVTALGPVPDDPVARAAWGDAAGAAAAYRERAGYEHPSDAIGPRPSPGAVDKRAAWVRAADALGIDDPGRALEGASDTRLREYRDRWARELTWAPPFVADRLRRAHAENEGLRDDGVELSLRLTRTKDRARRAVLRDRLAESERRRHELERRLRHLEQVHAARGRWAAATSEARDRARAADEILAHRHPDTEAREAAPASPDPGTPANLRQARRAAARAVRVIDTGTSPLTPTATPAPAQGLRLTKQLRMSP